MRINKTCLYCEKFFNIIPSREGKAKFCSRKCQSDIRIGKRPWNKGIKTGQIPKSAFKKGDPRIVGKNNTNYEGGAKTPNWKGGRIVVRNGYVLRTVNKKTITEHRYVMENYLGRKLKKEEQVHHVNGDKHDNRIENLMLFKNASDHTRYHHSLKHSGIHIGGWL